MKETVEKRVNMMPARHMKVTWLFTKYLLKNLQNEYDFKSSGASSVNLTFASSYSCAR